jgi:DNA mismatch repair protein MutS2
MIKDNCLCHLGRQSVDSIHYSVDLTEIETNLFQTDELRQILLFEGNFPSQDYFDLTPALSGIRLEGTYMEPEVLSELRLSLHSILQIQSYFTEHHPGKYTNLLLLAQEIAIDRQIPKVIDKIINDKSEIRDDASPALRKIRKDRSAKQAAVEKKIAQSFRLASQSGWTPEGTGLTIRNGRLVIPLLANHKRKISGLIHDESATGQTVYLEPAEIVEMNNEIKELDFAEHREIIRILTEFADYLRPSIDDLIRSYHILGRFDFIRAKARVAIGMNAHLPLIRINTPHILWKEAVHPLLYLSHSLQNKPVVPLNISLNPSQRILIISGPNAGGKSVCLKTVGLLQYMFQCSLLPPVHQDSEFGLFRQIFIDIGDEQSLENDLSTYSSKLLNLKFFIENLDESSLFLIDELGTGTDPSLGGTIAEASLEKINEKSPFGVVTTHYSNLKLLSSRLSGIENAAMLYDSHKMKPLFILQTGIPGSSFAFEIARQIGFPEDVLGNAAEKTGLTQLNFDRQLQDLELEKAEMTGKASELKVADDFLHELINKYQKLYDDLKKREGEIILKAKDEALSLLKESNKQIEKTIKEIRESQAEKA